MSALHVTPRPETVAAIIDGYGCPAARERWWWIGPNALSDLAAEGRRRTGRTRTVGDLHCLGAGHTLVSRGWDGPEARSPMLTPAVAAAALGVSAASLSRSGW